MSGHPPPPDAATATPRWRRHGRLAAWAVLTVIAGLFGLLALWPIRGPINQHVTLVRGIWVAGSFLPLATWLLLATTPKDAILVSPRLGKRLILLTAAALAASSLWLTSPTWSTDILRHEADGATWLSGRSPYRYTPNDSVTPGTALTSDDVHASAFATLLAAAPDRDQTSLAPPAVQAVIAASAAVELVLPRGSPEALSAVRIEPTDWAGAVERLPWWRRLFVLRLLLALIYFATVNELIAWMRQRNLSVWWAGLYAWSPAAWIGAGILGVAGGLAALLLIASLRRLEAERHRRSAVGLAGAVAASPLLLPLVPWMIVGKRQRSWLWFGLVSAAMWVPALTYQYGYGPSALRVARYLATPGDTLVGSLFVFAPAVGWSIWLAGQGLVAWLINKRGGGAATVVYGMTLSSTLLAPTSAVGLILLPMAVAVAPGRRGGLAAIALVASAGVTLSPNDATPPLATLGWCFVAAVGLLEALAAVRRTRRSRASTA